MATLADIDRGYMAKDPDWKRNAVKLGCLFLAWTKRTTLRDEVDEALKDERSVMWVVGDDLAAFTSWLKNHGTREPRPEDQSPSEFTDLP